MANLIKNWNMGGKLRTIIGDRFGAEVVEYNLEKALGEARMKAAAPQSSFYDPLSLFMGKQWLIKGMSTLSYQDMRAMSKNPIVGSIIQTRLNQIASYTAPQKLAHETGFKITSDYADANQDINRVQAMREFMYTCGIPGYGDDSFELFTRKFMRDSLTLDQACAEIVYQRNGTPAYFAAIDGGTIRKLKRSLEFATPPGTDPWYVQVLQERIVAEYTWDQLIFGVRNPQSDVRVLGYGMSELELLIRITTALINSEKYNSSLVAQGGTQKGVLVVKGEIGSRGQFEDFKRDFWAAIKGANEYWRPPIVNVAKDGAVDWVALDHTNRDLEYSKLFDFLVRTACAVYQISSEEIGWSVAPGGASTVFQSRSGASQKHSEDKGLKPLLNFLAYRMTQGVIQKMDDRYRLEFVGMGTDRAQQVDILAKEVKAYKTINDIRQEIGLDPIEGGNVVMASTNGVGPDAVKPDTGSGFGGGNSDEEGMGDGLDGEASNMASSYGYE